jgi:hypothetical protein
VPGRALQLHTSKLLNPVVKVWLAALYFGDLNSLYPGVICDGTHQYAILEVLSHKGASWNGIPEPFFRDIGIINTTPLQPNFGPLFVLQNFF